jgi:hypothetical protein
LRPGVWSKDEPPKSRQQIVVERPNFVMEGFPLAPVV